MGEEEEQQRRHDHVFSRLCTKREKNGEDPDEKVRG